jgi:hypothetical protein
LLSAATVLASICAITAPALANLVINPTFDTTIANDPNAAAIEATINSAIGLYESDFSNAITVTITFAEMSSGLGQSSTYFATVPYSQYRNALAADAATGNDATAMSLLPSSNADPVDGLTTIAVKTANLRAVGINVSPPAGNTDGTISLNTSLTTPGSSGTSSTYSLLTLTEHEIDEVLGLGSGLPGFSNIFPEDLFRYSALGVRSYTSATTNAYFSINGTTLLSQFNNTSNGAEYGDWASSATPQVQDAFGTPGANPTLGPNELIALDVIGYTPAVPEPATLGLLSGAVAGLASLRRRRRN